MQAAFTFCFNKGACNITLVLLWLSAASCFAAPIRVLVLDAHSSHPIRNTDVSVAIQGQKSAASYTTDTNGIITVDLDPAAKLIPSTGWRVTCRKVNSTALHWFSVQKIIEEGAVDENTCGKASSEPMKGTLVIFTRKSTFFENMAR